MAGLLAALSNFLLLWYYKSDRQNYIHQIHLEYKSKVEPSYHLIILKSLDSLTLSPG